VSDVDSAIAEAAAGLLAVAGTSVTYSRGASSVAVTGVPARSLFEVDNGVDELREQVESLDWLFEAADLVLASVTVTPQRGDKIAQAVGSETLTFEVLDIPNEGCYRWSDPQHTLIRVHARLVVAA